MDFSWFDPDDNRSRRRGPFPSSWTVPGAETRPGGPQRNAPRGAESSAARPRALAAPRRTLRARPGTARERLWVCPGQVVRRAASDARRPISRVLRTLRTVPREIDQRSAPPFRVRCAENTPARRRNAWHAKTGGDFVAAKFDFSPCFAYHNEIWDASPGKRPDRPAGGPPRPTGVTRRVGAPTLSKVGARGAPRPPGGAPATGGPPAQSICACRGRPRDQVKHYANRRKKSIGDENG